MLLMEGVFVSLWYQPFLITQCLCFPCDLLLESQILDPWLNGVCFVRAFRATWARTSFKMSSTTAWVTLQGLNFQRRGMCTQTCQCGRVLHGGDKAQLGVLCRKMSNFCLRNSTLCVKQSSIHAWSMQRASVQREAPAGAQGLKYSISTFMSEGRRFIFEVGVFPCHVWNSAAWCFPEMRSAARPALCDVWDAAAPGTEMHCVRQGRTVPTLLWILQLHPKTDSLACQALRLMGYSSHTR